MVIKAKKKEKALKHSKHVAWRKVAGEAVILDVDTAVYYSMGGVGLRIWELIGRKTPASKIVRVLSDEYEAPRSRIEGDLERLVRKLKREKLVEAA
ncbi:PqqD family protein [Elusimicrobiota bacterium]